MRSFVTSRPSPRYLVREPVGSEHEVDVVPGLRHSIVQSFDLFVADDGGSNLFTVVIASEPALSEHDRQVIAQALAATRRPELAFLGPDSAGEVLAESPTGGDPRQIAAAVAVVRSFAGREAARQIITVAGQSLSVDIEGDGMKWQCRVE